MGYLLSGKPGTGKSSLISYLACKFKMDIYNLRLKGLSDDKFQALMQKLLPHYIVALEDFNSMKFNNTMSSSNRSPNQGISPTTFLNALDSFTATTGRVVFIIVNNLSSIPPEMYCPGCINYIIRFSLLIKDYAKAMFLRFYPGRENEANDFIYMIPNRTITPAAL